MDQKRLSSSATTNRSSALPRPTSRLPQPRVATNSTPTPTLRSVASTEALRGRFAQSKPAHDPRAPNTTNTTRLRTAASRDQLREPSSPVSAALRKPQRPTAPPVSSQTAIRGATTRNVSRETSVERPASESLDGQFKKSLVARRRPSGQFGFKALQADSAIDEEVDQDELSSAVHLVDDASYGAAGTGNTARKSRPSLAERTLETLSQLPSSPVVKRRGSNFFEAGAPTGLSRSRTGSGSSRPGSSHQSDSSTTRSFSRPGSSSGPTELLRSSLSSNKQVLATAQGKPSRRASGIVRPLGFRPVATPSKDASSSPLPTTKPRLPSPEKLSNISGSKVQTKTGTTRTLKPRASMTGLLKNSSLPQFDDEAVEDSLDLPKRHPRKMSLSLASVRSAATANTNPSVEERISSSASTVSTTLTTDSAEGSSPTFTARKSSSALREQIAKAKAAKRAALRQVSGPTGGTAPLKSPLVPTDTTFDFGLSDDPFNQTTFEDSNRKVMQSRIEMARTTGRLNIAAMGIKQIPDEVVRMYDLESVGNHGSWAESVDLTRFVAADNELETLDESIFPDTDPVDLADAEDGRGHQFGGLEALDLHGNTLIALPLGLRRLQQLTSLNLAQNRLANGCLEVISQIRTLRDLKLGGNLLYGKMDSCFSGLANLEILDLRGNEITALPDGFEKLNRLRVLNLTENAFESLPFKTIAKLPIIELLAQKNKLAGTLVEVEVEALPHLQTLDVSNNQLNLISLGPMSMPSLLQLTVSLNRLQSLPNMSSWESLLTLNADENSITAIPDGFITLDNLKSADFTSNDIRVIPPQIARMDSLTLLRIAGNPLRDKRFASMTTEVLKDSLADRLEPLAEDRGGIEYFGKGFELPGAKQSSNGQSTGGNEITNTGLDEFEDSRSENDDFATPPTSAPQSPLGARSQPLSSQTWPIKPGGILDRANTSSSSLHPVVCSKLVINQTVREVRLQHNTFTNFPNSLSFFSDTLESLNISHNQLVGESYLTEELDLTALKELNLSHNHIANLAPLVTCLKAPNLQKLDISFNRVVSLPVLRDSFPSLQVLLVSSNHLEDLDPDSVAGLKIVAADNNDIAHLNPRLGLQAFDRLDVTGNRFRVPRWNVLERGTEATLRWLRGRVPVAEMAEWRAKSGNMDEDTDLD